MDFEESRGCLGLCTRSPEKNDEEKKGRGDTRSLDSCTLHSSGFGLSVLVLQPVDVYNNHITISRTPYRVAE